MDEDSFGSMNTMKAGGVPQGTAGRIDQYELVRKLGGGGFGVVWLVRDTVSGVEYALKTLHPLLKTNEEELERVRDNFALVAKLSHPNIATAHVLHRAVDVAYASEETRRELRVAPGDPVMLMSYAPGVTLSKWRKQFPEGRVPLDKALEIGQQVASALDYAHGERIVHRDIKPANVMVETDAETGRLRARVLDFGLAAEIRSSMSRVSQEKGETSGTRPYMAPEQWTGKRQDGRTDQYAFACMVYEMLDGRPPFAGAFETGDAGIMMAAIKSETPDEIDGLSALENAALLKALAKKREDRFATCCEFIAAMEGGIPVAEHVDRDAVTVDREIIDIKVELADKLSGVPMEHASDPELKPYYDAARRECRKAEEALKLCLKDIALDFWRSAAAKVEDAERVIVRREEAERRSREEAAERKARVEGSFAGEEREIEIAPGLKMAFVWVAPGSFRMGSDDGDAFAWEKPVHQVTLTKGYWLGKYEVTQAEWQSVMGKNPSRFKGERLPVERVSWDDCQEYVKQVNAYLARKGEELRVRLPTEAEWEFAARGGTKSKGFKYSGSGNSDDVAWYDGNSGSETHDVGTKAANELGIHDMSGNVWEWCADWYGDYSSGAVTDPRGPGSGDDRVSRGGGWSFTARCCRSAYRDGHGPGYRDGDLGVRLASGQ